MLPSAALQSVRGTRTARRRLEAHGGVGATWRFVPRPSGAIPTSRRLPPFPRRTSTAPRERSRSLSCSASASLIRSPARHSRTISATEAPTIGAVADRAHHRDDLLNRRWIGRVLLALVTRRAASVVA